MARPKKAIDFERASLFAVTQAPITEIAEGLEVDPSTLRRAIKRKFGISARVWVEQQRERGRAMLRAAQFQTAMAGNARLLIHLGRRWLGQEDRRFMSMDHSIESGSRDAIPLRVPCNGRRLIHPPGECASCDEVRAHKADLDEAEQTTGQVLPHKKAR